MNENNFCRLKKLKLTNFRCFNEILLELHDRLSIFVAPNGGGKSAILDGIAIALRLFCDTVEERNNSKGFDPSDIRQVINPTGQMEQVTPVRFEAYGCFFDVCLDWSRERHSEKSSRTTTSEAEQFRKIAKSLAEKNKQWAQTKTKDSPVFPVIAYYGTGRLWATTRLNKSQQKQAKNARYRGYTDCLLPSSHYKFFLEWFQRHLNQILAVKVFGEGKDNSSEFNLIKSVKDAVNLALSPSGWQNLDWDFNENLAVATHPEKGTLPVDWLSDGIRNMIGLVADIAHRAARLNPHFGAEAHLKTPGIVLIDEVDMHLHPSWQQKVLQSLQDAFPMVQFIVTTHSPQVLSTAPAESIFIVEPTTEGWIVNSPPHQTQGVESSLVMAEVMHTDQIPPIEIVNIQNEYYQHIHSHSYNSEQALALRQRLIEHFGQNHSVIKEADQLINLEEFKLKLKK